MENIVWKDTVWKNIVWKNTARKNTVLDRLDPFKTVETVLNPLQLEFLCLWDREGESEAPVQQRGLENIFI